MSRPDRFDHEVEFIGAVDLARYAVGHIGPDELGFGEVIEPVNALRVAVLHQEHRTRTVFRPREQEQMIGAEVEHARDRKDEREPEAPARLGSAVEGLARRTPPCRVIVTARRLHRSRPQLLGRRIRILGLAQAVAAQQEDLGVLHQAVGDGGGDGRIEEDVAPVGERLCWW